MTVIVLPAAADPPADPDGVVVPGLAEHAVATSRATSATIEKDLVDRAIDTPPREDTYSTAPARWWLGSEVAG
jgi:hypothetical protein